MKPIRQKGALPLEQYAALGDGRSVALVGADGSVDWWCVPNMDSPPLFDRLLDPIEGGWFCITPTEPFSVERRYRTDSNVLEQVFTTATGTARITDSLNSGISGRLPWCELARRIEGLEGHVEFHIASHPGRRLDQASSWRESGPHGDVLHVDGIMAAFRGDESIERLVRDDAGITARLVTSPGSRSLAAVLASDREPLILPTLAAIDTRIDRSDQSWREWSANLTIPEPYAADLRRAALALKLLLFSPTGAIAAAATISLPERIGGDKNYDYRYAWVRDVAYTVKAFLHVDATEEAKAAFSWMTATVKRHGELRVMYRLDGGLPPDEETVLDLPGYRGSQPVRTGNRALGQLQLSCFGDVLEVASLFVRSGHLLDLGTRRLLADLVDRCADLWRNRDSGIWELDRQEHYTISKIGCWMALDRGIALAALGQVDTSHVERWARQRDRIADWIDANCWSDAKQSYVLHPGTDRLDASLLLAIPFKFPRADRLTLTRQAIQRELCRGPLVYRMSGMEAEEGTFLACAFWLVEALALEGHRDEAIRQMDALLAVCNANLGLLHEQMAPDGYQMLGNVPQALSHLALIHAGMAIEEGHP